MKLKELIVLSACLLLFAGCKQETRQVEGSGYKLMELKTSDRELSVKYSTTLQGRQDVEIRPQVGGTITQVLVKEGAKVRKGQTLFVIDPVPYEAALQTAKAAVATAEANVATAELNLEGRQQLYDQQVISDFELRTSQNNLRTAEAALAQAQAEEVNAANSLSYTQVTSPVDGVAGITSYRVGALVSSSIADPLVNVSDNSVVYAYFSMGEKQVLSLTRQYGSLQNALDSMPAVELQLNDGSLYGTKGKIDVISGIVDKQTGAVSLRAIFDNKDGRLMSGGSANVIIPYEKKDCIVIPQEATFEIQDKIYAYKVVDGKAESVLLTVFEINDGREYIVESGLAVGDVIVAEGAGLLREGTVVSNQAAE